MPKAFHAALMTALALAIALSAVALLRVGVEGATPPTSDSHSTTTTGRYIVQLADPPLATYAGGVSGLPATAAAKTGARRLDTSAAASIPTAKDTSATPNVTSGGGGWIGA